MGGSVSIVNNTTCALTVALEVLAPYYWENMLLPGQSMNRNGVGHVWFTISAYPWHGLDNEYVIPYDVTPELLESSIEEFTLLGNLGVRGAYWRVIDKHFGAVDWTNATKFEVAIFGNYWVDRSTLEYYVSPLSKYSNGWYIYNENVWELRGGPQCELRNETYWKDGILYNKTLQIIENSMALQNFEVVRIV